MSNALTMKTFSMPKGQELQDLTSFCKVMADSPFYRKLGAGGVMSIVLTAKELNLPMMPCLNGGMHNINGAVSLSAQLMNALIIMNGHKADLIHLDEHKCEIHFKRRDSNRVVPYVYSVEDAKKAGYLMKDNWRNHLKDMLYCRCLSGGGRKVMPDAFLGCYVHGEIDSPDILLQPVLPAEQNEIVEPQQKEEPKQIDFEKAEGFDEFVKKHGLKKKGLKADYVKAVASSSNKTIDEIINFAINNEEGFESAFKKWSEANKKTDSEDHKEEEPDQ